MTIGKYDDIRNQINSYMIETKDKRISTLNYRMPKTSHERIEQIYESIKGV